MSAPYTGHLFVVPPVEPMLHWPMPRQPEAAPPPAPSAPPIRIVAFLSTSCPVTRSLHYREGGTPAFGGTVDLGDLSPAEAVWSRGETVMEYPTDYRPAIRAALEEAVPLGPALELARLIESQPYVRPDHSPFQPINTSRAEIESEARKARAAGLTLRSLDFASTDDGVTVTLADTVPDPVVREDPLAYTTIDPTVEYRIASERIAAKSSPLLRTHLVPSPRGGAWVRTEGEPYQGRMRIERLNGEQVYVFNRHRLARPHYKALEKHYRRWLAGWAPEDASPRVLEALGRNFSRARRTGRRPIDDAFDPDPYRFRHRDQLLEEPFEEPVVELTDEEAVARFGRPLDLLYAEEIQELTEVAIEQLREAGLEVPMVYHLRGHPNHLVAARARVHNEGASYLAGEADILA